MLAKFYPVYYQNIAFFFTLYNKEEDLIMCCKADTSFEISCSSRCSTKRNNNTNGGRNLVDDKL
eukprot:9471171-Ditylum_brightwellii.AAC.1